MLSLEPRLQEYLIKKKYFKENNINPGVPLEQEYRISPEDKKTLKNYLLGERNLYGQPYNISPQATKKPQNLNPDDLVVPKKTPPINRGMFGGSPSNYDDLAQNYGPKKNNPNNNILLDPYNYQMELFMDPRKPIDSLLESDIIRGEASRTRTKPEYKNKNISYKNLESQSNPKPLLNNMVEPWDRGGINTRLENKKSNKKDITREIYQ